MTKPNSKTFLAIGVFIVFMTVGLASAFHRPVWNDELYSHSQSIKGMSYLQILKGEVPEGNNSPLFYFTQKLFCDILSVHTPEDFSAVHYYYYLGDHE